jgi:hypothetical protein
MRRTLVALFFSLSACSTLSVPTSVVPEKADDWSTVITDDDRSRLSGWRQEFTSAIAEARKGGHAAEIAREGMLLEPDAALPNPAIPNGLYRCRAIKLGSKSPGLLPYVSYPAFTCQVAQSGKVQSFAKLNGSQRQVGILFPNDALRSVFLGTLVLGDESRALRYAADEERDVAGYLERIGPDRWRLVMPSPHFESKLDVLELVRAGKESKP